MANKRGPAKAVKSKPPLEDLRSQIMAIARWALQHERDIHYSQQRPIDGSKEARPKTPLYIDCSGFVTLCYKWGGAPDPNGRNYDGHGYTGTLLGNCRQISAGSAQLGDLVLFGPGPGDHVALLSRIGHNTEVISHGQEKGPFRISLAAEAAAHSPPVRFLRGKRMTARDCLRVDEDFTLPVDLSNASNPPTDP